MMLKYDSGAGSRDYVHSVVWKNPQGTITSGPTTYRQSVPTSRKWVYGENLDRFLTRKKAGEILGATPYRNYEYSVTPYGATYPRKIVDSMTGHVMTTTGDPTFTSWFPVELYVPEMECERLMEQSGILGDLDNLIEAAVAKCTAGYDVGTSLAEFKDVIHSFTRAGNSLRQLCATVFAKDEWRDLYMKPLHASSCWLELRYSWRTLLADVRELSKAIAGLSTPKFPRQRNRSGSSRSTTSLKTYKNQNDFGVHTLTVSDRCEINLRGNALYECENSGFFINPVMTAWQLTRLSFVVDWFANITRWLQAWSTELMFKGQTWASIKVEVVRDWSFFTTTPAPRYGYVNFSERYTSRSTLLLRQPTGLSIFPSGLKCNLSSFQIIDLIALFLQSVYKRVARLGR